jgi:ubiquinone/menaquinone biosynthesis C-methylase UbiE
MYNEFAQFYSSLNMNADYEKRAEYILSLFERFDKKPSLMLDLCCGTGEFTRLFSKSGISMIGVDISPEMLSEATSRDCENLYLCQNAAELDLYGTVDGAVCMLDSLNHITDYGDFKKALEKVSLFLEKDRLFIFDMNTPYKHESVLANNTFVIENEEVYCVWQNEYDKDNALTRIYLDFFCGDGENYTRTTDYFEEKVYSLEEITSAISGAGLKTEGIFGEFTLDSPADNTERYIFVTRKV